MNEQDVVDLNLLKQYPHISQLSRNMCVFSFQTGMVFAAELVDNELHICGSIWGKLLSRIQVIQNEMHIEADFTEHALKSIWVPSSHFIHSHFLMYSCVVPLYITLSSKEPITHSPR